MLMVTRKPKKSTGRPTPTEKQIDEMVRLYNSGLSMAEVGRRVGCCSQTVSKYLKQRGFENG